MGRFIHRQCNRVHCIRGIIVFSAAILQVSKLLSLTDCFALIRVIRMLHGTGNCYFSSSLHGISLLGGNCHRYHELTASLSQYGLLIL